MSNKKPIPFAIEEQQQLQQQQSVPPPQNQGFRAQNFSLNQGDFRNSLIQNQGINSQKQEFSPLLTPTRRQQSDIVEQQRLELQAQNLFYNQQPLQISPNTFQEFNEQQYQGYGYNQNPSDLADLQNLQTNQELDTKNIFQQQNTQQIPQDAQQVLQNEESKQIQSLQPQLNTYQQAYSPQDRQFQTQQQNQPQYFQPSNSSQSYNQKQHPSSMPQHQIGNQIQYGPKVEIRQSQILPSNVQNFRNSQEKSNHLSPQKQHHQQQNTIVQQTNEVQSQKQYQNNEIQNTIFDKQAQHSPNRQINQQQIQTNQLNFIPQKNLQSFKQIQQGQINSNYNDAQNQENSQYLLPQTMLPPEGFTQIIIHPTQIAIQHDLTTQQINSTNEIIENSPQFDQNQQGQIQQKVIQQNLQKNIEIKKSNAQNQNANQQNQGQIEQQGQNMGNHIMIDMYGNPVNERQQMYQKQEIIVKPPDQTKQDQVTSRGNNLQEQLKKLTQQNDYHIQQSNMYKQQISQLQQQLQEKNQLMQLQEKNQLIDKLSTLVELLFS